jgi:hypothetical protein
MFGDCEAILAPLPKHNIRQVKKKRRMIQSDFNMTMELGGFEMKDVMLDLGSDMKILHKESSKLAGKPKLV